MISYEISRDKKTDLQFCFQACLRQVVPVTLTKHIHLVLKEELWGDFMAKQSLSPVLRSAKSFTEELFCIRPCTCVTNLKTIFSGSFLGCQKAVLSEIHCVEGAPFQSPTRAAQPRPSHLFEVDAREVDRLCPAASTIELRA
jgi:hypothetical protein